MAVVVVCDVSRLQQTKRLRVDVPAGLQFPNSPLPPVASVVNRTL